MCKTGLWGLRLGKHDDRPLSRPNTKPLNIGTGFCLHASDYENKSANKTHMVRVTLCWACGMVSFCFRLLL